MNKGEEQRGRNRQSGSRPDPARERQTRDQRRQSSGGAETPRRTVSREERMRRKRERLKRRRRIAIAILCGMVLLLILIYLRMFSRNISKRYAENQKYLELENKVKRFFGRQKYIQEQRKDFHIYTCPQCRQKIRIPKGKGKISIRCPKCGAEFVKKS